MNPYESRFVSQRITFADAPLNISIITIENDNRLFEMRPHSLLFEYS